jgi:hypothetical protein
MKKKDLPEEDGNIARKMQCRVSTRKKEPSSECGKYQTARAEVQD